MKMLTSFLLIVVLVLTSCPAPVGPQNGDSSSDSSSDSSVDAKVYPFFTDAENVFAAGQHVFIHKSDKSVWAVGNNEHGQLADGTTIGQTVPIKVMDGVESIWGGSKYSGFIKTDGSIWAAGANDSGQLGIETPEDDTPEPQEVEMDFKSSSGSEKHTMFLKENGELWASGKNDKGELGTKDTYSTERIPNGQGSIEPVKVPVKVMDNVRAVATGAGGHTMVITKDDSLWAFGRGREYQLGVTPIPAYIDAGWRKQSRIDRVKDEARTANTSTPIKVEVMGTDVDRVFASYTYSMVIKKSDGSLHFVGIIGTEDQRVKPLIGKKPPPTGVKISKDWEEIVPGGQLKRISATNGSILVIKNDDSLWAMGRNEYGQLGNGTTDNLAELTKVMDGVKRVFAGFEFTYFIKMDDTLWAVGRNQYGQLGDGTKENRMTPVRVRMNVK